MMIRTSITAGFVALLALSLPVSATTESEAKEQVITQEKAWSDAVIHHDVARVASILADDFIGIDGRGFVSDKTTELKEAESLPADSTAPQLIKEDLSDFSARIYGNVAVLNLTNTAHFVSKEKQTEIKYRRTTVWVRSAETWRCVSFHASRILEAPKK